MVTCSSPDCSYVMRYAARRAEEELALRKAKEKEEGAGGESQDPGGD